ncbi:MAG TPA: hypothetical protein VGA08_04245, partial [Candidatus Saccharimonadales bacterium]
MPNFQNITKRFILGVLMLAMFTTGALLSSRVVPVALAQVVPVADIIQHGLQTGTMAQVIKVWVQRNAIAVSEKLERARKEAEREALRESYLTLYTSYI